MAALLLVACAAFGALDQYVSSLTRFWPQAWEVGALSAPWLVLPFVVGTLQRRATRAAVLGLLATYVALCGYGLMTVSPIEHAHLSVTTFAAFVRSNVTWFAGAVVTGPLFGWLGHRWRVARSPYAAAAVAVAVMLEPLVHAAHIRPIPLNAVTGAELAAGVAMAAWFASIRRRHSPQQQAAATD